MSPHEQLIENVGKILERTAEDFPGEDWLSCADAVGELCNLLAASPLWPRSDGSPYVVTVDQNLLPVIVDRLSWVCGTSELSDDVDAALSDWLAETRKLLPE